jgi:DNA-binding CsgD family transcriptional regulator
MRAHRATATPVRRSCCVASVVGRRRELALIDSFVDAVPEHSGALFLIGEAGIGKTTLLHHGIRRARSTGHRVLEARPLADGASGDGGLMGLFGLGPRDQGVLDDAHHLLDVVGRMCSEGPVLLAIDDLHELDVARARALRRVVQGLEQRPVALLAAARSWSPGDSAGPPPPTACRSERLDIGPMPLADLRQLVAEAMDTPLSRPELAHIHRITGGNPLFVLETARAWRRDGPHLRPGSPLEALADHLSVLTDEATAVARCVAVAGPAPVSVVARAANIGDFEAAVRDAVRAGVLVVDEDFTIRFSHALFATATLATVNPLDRRALHARLADLVLDTDARTRHRGRSIVGADEAVARELERTAERAARRGAADIAADDLAHSVRLTPCANDRDAVRRALAEAANRAACGQAAAAVRLVDGVLARLGPGEQRADALTQRVFLDFADSESFLAEALRCTTDPAGRARALDLLGWVLGTYRGRLDEGAEHSAEALAIARSIGDRELTMLAATTYATARLFLGRPMPDLISEAVAIGDQRELPRLGRWPRTFRGRHHLWNGRLAEAQADFEETTRTAGTLGSEFQRPYRLYDEAMLELASGDVGRARRLAEEGAEAATDAGNDQAMVWLAYPLGMAGAHQGDADLAGWAADRLEGWAIQCDEPPRTAMAAEVRGTLAAAGGDWHAALDRFEAGVAILDSLGYRHPGVIPVLARAVEAAAVLGDLDRGHRHATALDAQAAGLDAPWVDAQVVHGRGALLFLEGEVELAIEVFAYAAETVEKLGYRLDATRIRLAQARACIRAGRKAMARSLVDACRVDLAAMGATAWVVTAADDLAERVGACREGALTSTETQIARLVAAGRRNREIASEMFISVSTVEAHLTRMYRKFGVRSRTELVQLVGAN